MSSETAEDTGDAILVDVRGLKCPLPVLKTARRMEPHPKGSLFLVRTTDPMAAIDVPHFCRENGHQLISSGKDGAELYFRIEKG